MSAENMDTTEAAAAAAAAAAAEDDRKLFVGGLPQGVKDEDIRKHFEQFGEIGPDGINHKTDGPRSRGFGFVVYVDTVGVEKALAAESHCINSKEVAVKKAQAKPGKIYVGKLNTDLSDDEIKEFFAQYGSISQVEQPFDKIKNERKNFCFITFEKEEIAKRLLKEQTVSIKGHELEIKRVTPKPAGGPMGMGGFGGRGGGRGGQNFGGYGGPQQWAGGYGGYGDASGYWGYGGPEAAYAGYGYGPGFGGNQWGYGGMAGGKTRGGPRGGGAARGRGVGAGRGQRQKPY